MHRHPCAWLIGLLPALAGCLHIVHPSHKLDPCEWRLSDQVPAESKSCVYLFLFDPLDPLTCANVKGLRGYAHDLGFGKTYYGQGPHLTYFLEKMRMLHGTCGGARFAIIGYASGAEAARQLAERAGLEGIPVDLTIFLEPKGEGPWEGEPGTMSSFTIRAEDLPPVPKHKDSEHPPSAVRKMDVVMHPQTLQIIERELSLIAMTVPPPQRPEYKWVPLVDPIPAPRDTVPNPRPLPDEWKFLRPREPWSLPPEQPREPSEILPLPKSLHELPLPKEKPEP